MTQVGFQGALLVMIAHGLYSGLLFSMVGLVYERTHTREVGMMSGLAKRMPFTATVFMFAGLASLGLPGLAGFVAEFTTFIGAYSIFPLATILCVCTIAITAGYILWRLGSVFFGPLTDNWATLGDAIWRERLAVGVPGRRDAADRRGAERRRRHVGRWGGPDCRGRGSGRSTVGDAHQRGAARR